MNDAFATWSAANAIADQIEPFDIQKQRQLNNQRPWASDPLYFKRTRISALALLKILIHARSGNTIEVMGSLVGYITADCIVVNDVFILPVEGTETRVNAGAEAYEYMVEFSESNKKVDRIEVFCF